MQYGFGKIPIFTCRLQILLHKKTQINKYKTKSQKLKDPKEMLYGYQVTLRTRIIKSRRWPKKSYLTFPLKQKYSKLINKNYSNDLLRTCLVQRLANITEYDWNVNTSDKPQQTSLNRASKKAIRPTKCFPKPYKDRCWEAI